MCASARPSAKSAVRWFTTGSRTPSRPRRVSCVQSVKRATSKSTTTRAVCFEMPRSRVVLLMAAFTAALITSVSVLGLWGRAPGITRADIRASLRKGNAASNSLLLKGCTHVYLDVGTNLGVQIRKLFEPELYPHSAMLAFFDQWFGDGEERRALGPSLCAVGFEPNPQHQKRLDFLEECYLGKMGWRTRILRVAVSDGADNEVVSFNTDPQGPNMWGARVSSPGEINVTTMNFARFFRDEVLQEPREFVGAKFDVEGAEYGVFTEMLREGLLGAVDAATVEWHAHESLGSWRIRAHMALRAPQFVELDDESYASDGQPWPDKCVLHQ